MPMPIVMIRALRLGIALALSCGALAIDAVAQREPLPNPGGFNMFSKQQDVQVGQQNAAQVSKQMPVLPDSSPVTQYVQQLGRKLAATMPQPTYPYNFHVVQQKDINAFALPGGPIFVNLGTITAADNEAQLAGVMAHEMSHVYMRHSTKMATRQALAQAPLALLGGMVGNGMIGQLAQLGISFGVNSYFLKYSRGDEAQADATGAEIMYNAGYNPVAMADFFRKLEQGGGARGPQFLSDHPNPGNRVQAVSHEISSFPQKQFQQDSAQFQRAKQEAVGVRAYTAQEIQQRAKQGGFGYSGANPSTRGTAAGNSALPNGNFQTFNHQEFQIRHPANWQVFGDQSSNLTIAPRAGVSQGSVALGVIISGYQPEGTASLDDATHQLMSSLRQSNPDLRVIGHDEDIRVNGVAGKSVDFIGTSPLQQNGRGVRERDWLVSLQRQDGSLLYLVFISPDAEFGQVRPAFEEMLRSLQMR